MDLVSHPLIRAYLALPDAQQREPATVAMLCDQLQELSEPPVLGDLLWAWCGLWPHEDDRLRPLLACWMEFVCRDKRAVAVRDAKPDVERFARLVQGHPSVQNALQAQVMAQMYKLFTDGEAPLPSLCWGDPKLAAAEKEAKAQVIHKMKDGLLALFPEVVRYAAHNLPRERVLHTYSPEREIVSAIQQLRQLSGLRHLPVMVHYNPARYMAVFSQRASAPEWIAAEGTRPITLAEDMRGMMNTLAIRSLLA